MPLDMYYGNGGSLSSKAYKKCCCVLNQEKAIGLGSELSNEIFCILVSQGVAKLLEIQVGGWKR